MEKETPQYAQIDIIRNYQVLPEKMYKRKLLALIILDLLIFFAYYNGRIRYEKLQDYPNLIAIKDLPVIILIFSIGLIGGFLAYLTLKCIVPDLLKNTLGSSKGLVKKLNPFNARGKEYSNIDDIRIQVDKKLKKDIKERKKRQGKSEPFIYFRESKVGKALRDYLVFLHFFAYANLFTQTKPIETHNYFKIQVLITFILYFLLSKEPHRTRKIAETHLKTAFNYYCSPEGAPRLSTLQKDTFEENFQVSIRNESGHRKGYWNNGVFQNQEFTYRTTIYVQDLKAGFYYLLEYPTNSDYRNWGNSRNKEIVTKRGLREV